MKKIILTLALVLGFSQFSNAQVEFGGGLALGGITAVEAKVNFGVSDKISVSPYLDYYLGYGTGYTFMTINADAHYNFEINDKFAAYPLLGLGYWTVIGDGTVLNARTIGVNAGGGATYALSDSMKLYGELKLAGFGAGLSVGVLFSL